MYENLNYPPETDEEKNIRHLGKRRLKYKKKTQTTTPQPENWTALGLAHQINSSYTIARQELRNAQNGENPDISQNVADQDGILTL